MTADINLTPTCTYFEIGGGRMALPARSWGTPNDSRSAALLVHGLGAHSGWFEAFARQLKVRRIYTVSFDLKGFGKRRDEWVDDASVWVDEVIFAYDNLRRQLGPSVPINLIGNSAGALLCIAACEFIRPDGLILCSPGFQGYPKTFTKQYQLVTILKACLWPQLEVEVPYTPDMVSRDPASVRFMTDDVMRRFKLPGKMLLELLLLSQRTMKWLKHLEQFPAPLLMLTAGQDRIVDNVASEQIYRRIPAPYKQAHSFEHAWHDLMFDPVVDEVADWVLRWQGYLRDGSAGGTATGGMGSR